MSEPNDFHAIMTEEEVLVLTRITTGDAPHSQRAQALLAVNAGKTETEAAELSGLRTTQVKYWITRYRKLGLAAFPQALRVEDMADVASEKVEETEIVIVEETAVSAKEPIAPKKDKKKKKSKNKKEKKEKKSKSKKKKKVVKKDKPSKKDKKSKKSKKEKKNKKAKSKKK